MKKSIKLLSCMLLMSLSCVVMGACGGCKENETPPAEPSSAFELIEPPTTLIVGGEQPISYYLAEGDRSLMAFTSSNQDVATVDKDGTVTAVKPGETTITCVYNGGYSESFTVTVETGGILPSLTFQEANDFEGTNNINVATSVYVKPTVLFNGKSFEDFTVNYAVDNPEICTVDEATGTLTAIKKGEATLTVTASWRGIESSELTREIKFNVLTNYEVSFNDNQITEKELYLAEEHNGKTYDTFLDLSKLAVKLNGVDRTADADIDLTDNLALVADEQALTYVASEEKIKAVRSGSAKLHVRLEADGETFSKTIDLTVKRVVEQVEGTSTFVLNDGKIQNLASYIGENGVLQDGYVGGDEFTGTALTIGADNTIVDYTPSNPNEMDNQTFTVYADNVGYAFNLNIVQGVIRQASDLAVLRSNTLTDVIGGYWIVEKDILWDKENDENNFYAWSKANSSASCRNDNSISTFNGTFDGQGHRIEYGAYGGGLFGRLGDNAVIKNASLILMNVKVDDTTKPLKGQSRYSIIAAATDKDSTTTVHPTLENVYAGYGFALDASDKVGMQSFAFNSTTTAYSYDGIGLFGVGVRFEMKNVIVDMSKVTGITQTLLDAQQSVYYGIFGCRWSQLYQQGYKMGSNVHVVWNNKVLTYEKSGSTNEVSYIGYALGDRDDAEFKAWREALTFTGSNNNQYYNKCGLKRYADYAAMVAAGTTQVGNFAVTADGVTWIK